MLPIDRAITDEWGSMSRRRPIPVVDGLLAATVKGRRLILALSLRRERLLQQHRFDAKR